MDCCNSKRTFSDKFMSVLTSALETCVNKLILWKILPYNTVPLKISILIVNKPTNISQPSQVHCRALWIWFFIPEVTYFSLLIFQITCAVQKGFHHPATCAVQGGFTHRPHVLPHVQSRGISCHMCSPGELRPSSHHMCSPGELCPSYRSMRRPGELRPSSCRMRSPGEN